MKNTIPTSTVSFFNFICSAFGHDYYETTKVTNHISEYKCSHCGKEVTDNASGQIEILTNKNREINASLASFFKKKNNRIVVE